MIYFPKMLDLIWLKLMGHGQTRIIKLAHRRLVDCPDFQKSTGRGMNGLEGITLEFA